MSEPTSYIVLGRFETGGWMQIGEAQPATSAEGAIRAVAAKLKPEAQAGTYVAVPQRSWKPVQVRAEQTIVLKLEQPADPS